MKISINIYPVSFPTQPDEWEKQLQKTIDRARDHILEATVNATSFCNTELTILDDNQYIVATVKVEREGRERTLEGMISRALKRKGTGEV